MDELLLKMDGEMEVRGLRETTRATYVRQVREFGEHFGRDPGELGLEEVESYLLYLTRERGRCASSSAPPFAAASGWRSCRSRECRRSSRSC